MRISDWSSDVCSSDLEDERDHRQRRAMRHKKREEMQLMPPETHDQNDRKTQDRQNAGRGEMAGEGEGVNPHKPQRQHAQQIGEQNEHEQRKDLRREQDRKSTRLNSNH